MAIGTPVSLGTASAASGSTTLALTTTNTALAGSIVVVFTAATGSASPTSVADAAGNTYVGGTAVANGTGKSRQFYTFVTSTLSSGQAITVTYSGTGGSKLASAATISGLAARDASGAGAFGTSTAPSIATGSLSWPAEIVLGYTQVSGGAGDSFTESPGFTSLASVLSTDALRAAYQIVSQAASVTYAPTLGTSRTWGANLLTFSAQDTAGRAFAARQSFLTL